MRVFSLNIPLKAPDPNYGNKFTDYEPYAYIDVVLWSQPNPNSGHQRYQQGAGRLRTNWMNMYPDDPTKNAKFNEDHGGCRTIQPNHFPVPVASPYHLMVYAYGLDPTQNPDWFMVPNVGEDGFYIQLQRNPQGKLIPQPFDH